MNDMLYLYAVVVALAAVLVSIAVWAPRKLWVRAGALSVAFLFMPGAYASYTLLLSQPKPVSLEWARRSLSEATVLSYSLVEGKAIYVWLRTEAFDEPRSYVLPWSREVAQQLIKAQQQVKRRGGKTKMRRPFRRDRDQTKPIFYAETPRPGIAKPMRSRPRQYRHPGTDR